MCYESVGMYVGVNVAIVCWLVFMGSIDFLWVHGCDYMVLHMSMCGCAVGRSCKNI